METTESFFPNKQQLVAIAYMYEAEPVQPIDPDNFEDITEELFDTVDNHLDSMELICKPKFNLDDTMSSI